MTSEHRGGHTWAFATCPERGRGQLITVLVLTGLVVLAFLGLGWRCYYLQCLRADHYVELGLGQQFRSYLPLEPQRGAILDCRGRVLAASNQVRIIFADPKLIDDPKETASALAPILSMKAHEICKLIVDRGAFRYAPIMVGADVNQRELARAIEGVGIQYGWRRYYPMGDLASHVVGYTGVDNRGLGGIEYQYDRPLRGHGAQHSFFVDVHRRPIGFCLEGDEDNAVPTHGAGIILTLDATIQQFAREALQAQYNAFQAEGAMGMVVDPKTGAILAMVSLPDFDPAEARHTDPARFYNRALTDQYEPGSIIKPIVAAIALDMGLINRRETIFCENGHYRGKGFGRIGEYRRGFGDLTVREILVNSSNIGMAKIGQRLGAERLYEGLTLFGFGRKVGVELPGEAEGLLRPPGQWTGYSVTRIPFGQEISVTALQMLKAFCMLANGGRVVHPYLVKAMVEPDGSLTDMRPSPLRVGYVIKPEVAHWVVTEALAGVVNEGTGKRAQLEKWQVFGKTGTAQIAKPDGRGYQDKAYIASFICGAPAEDPRVIVLVSIRRPNVALKKGYNGGVVASPVAAAILEKTLTYLEATSRPDATRPALVSAQRRGIAAGSRVEPDARAAP